jgi:uncharacterized small protein (DUF1192 family)
MEEDFPSLETQGQRPYFPPAVVMFEKEMVNYVIEAAASIEAIELEVLTVGTETEAETAALRIEQIRSIERERLGANRVEGVSHSGEELYTEREKSTAIIIKSPDLGRLNTFWGEFERLKAERLNQSD